MNISEYIPTRDTGRSITAKELSALTGKKEAYIRKLINEERANGIPICSTTRGYHLSNDDEDVQSTINFLKRRVNTQMRAILGLMGRR